MATKKKKEIVGYPSTPRIYQRRLGEPITLDNYLPGSSILLEITAPYIVWEALQEAVLSHKKQFSNDFLELFVRQHLLSRYRRKDGKISVKQHLYGHSLKVIASPEDWARLESHILFRDNYFPFDFWGAFVGPACEASLEGLAKPEKGPHGSQITYGAPGKKHNASFADDMKIQASLLYHFFSLCLKEQKEMSEKDSEELMKEFNKIMKEVPSEYVDALNAGEHDPLMFTSCCMQIIFGKYLERFNIAPFYAIRADPHRFRDKYVYAGNRILRNVCAETLDKVWSLWAFNNYLSNQTDTSQKYNDLFDLMRQLVADYLYTFSPNYQ